MQVDKYLQALHAEFPDAIWITGGAVGLDTWAAMFAMRHSIPLWLILPFPPSIMTKFWNERMVDLSDMLAAFFNGSAGGTANCVAYARKIGYPIRLFNSF